MKGNVADTSAILHVARGEKRTYGGLSPSMTNLYLWDTAVSACMRTCAVLSFAKILAGCEINSLHTFLNWAVCYHCCPCSTSSGFGWAHFPAVFTPVEACFWRIGRLPFANLHFDTLFELSLIILNENRDIIHATNPADVNLHAGLPEATAA